MLYEALKASKGIYTNDTLAKMWGAKLRKGGAVETSITGNLPLTFDGLKAAVLRNYRLYGTASGSGVETENLFDGIIYQDDTIITGQSGATQSNSNYALGNYINVGDATVITMAFQYEHDTTTTRSFFPGLFYDAQQNLMGTNIAAQKPSEGAVEIHITVPANAMYFQPQWKKTTDTDIMVILGSTAPTTYIPYGYKLSLTVTSGQNTDTYPLYIGSTKLGAEEYVDYESGKVWRMVDGTLTPTDPPAPLPEITAYEDENTLSSTEVVGSVTITGYIKEQGE